MMMLPRLVDFHCHLDLYEDYVSAFHEREREGVFTLAVTTTPKAWPRNCELTTGAKFTRAALGLHPQLISEHEDEFDIWERYSKDARFIGEVGLDATPRYYRSFDRQKELFTQILRLCAEQGGKILSVHSVRAIRPVLDLVERNLPPSRGTVVLHWFTGTRMEAVRAIEQGCYFSINNEMLKKEKHRKLIAELPQDRILTESDGPFTSKSGLEEVKELLDETVRAIADIRHVDSIDMAQQILSNVRIIIGV